MFETNTLMQFAESGSIETELMNQGLNQKQTRLYEKEICQRRPNNVYGAVAHSIAALRRWTANPMGKRTIDNKHVKSLSNEEDLGW